MALWLLTLWGCEEGLNSRPFPEGPEAPQTEDTGLEDTGLEDTGLEDPLGGPELYPDDRIQSPITEWVAEVLGGIASVDGPQGDVFMKVGASSTVSQNTLYCFAGDDVELDAYEPDLDAALHYFLGGDAAGSTPFDRDTLAAISGKTASWAISGDPSPVEQEIVAIDPRIAVIHYGTNDMGMGSTYESAMPSFYESMMDLIDDLVDQGIVPVLTGISHRGDRASADLWAETYNALIRGMAQARQVPFIDLHLAMDPLEGHGLSSDGLHLEAYSGGACVLTEEGLEHGYNMRNLIVLQALDRLVRILVEGRDPPEASVARLVGDGSPADPFEIPTLPFADTRDTRDSPHRRLDVYTGCDSEADESGPEFLYRLSLDAPTALRALVQDRGDVDIDVHLLDVTGSEAGCLARAHRTIEATVPAGDYLFALDTWVDGDGDARGGEYTFVIQECEEGDSDCG